jgi:hypothetical protein
MKEFYEFSKEKKTKFWKDGEWVNEPDLVIFSHNGFKCTVKRVSAYESNGSLFGGYLCGYVRIPEDHYLYDKDLDHVDDLDLDCHGGVTHCNFNEWGDYYIGFDCAHGYDMIPSMEKMDYNDNLLKECRELLNEIPTYKNNDNLKEYRKLLNKIHTYKNIDFVTKECKKLVDSIINLEESNRNEETISN